VFEPDGRLPLERHGERPHAPGHEC
jgi:hypothetical protein